MPSGLFYVKKFAVRRGASVEMYVVAIPQEAKEKDPTAEKIVDAIENTREYGTPEQLIAVVDNLLKNSPQYIRKTDKS